MLLDSAEGQPSTRNFKIRSRVSSPYVDNKAAVLVSSPSSWLNLEREMEIACFEIASKSRTATQLVLNRNMHFQINLLCNKPHRRTTFPHN